MICHLEDSSFNPSGTCSDSMDCNACSMDLQQISGACFSQSDSISVVVWPSYRGRFVPFGQIVFGLDPKADKYRPAWVRGAWLGKGSTDMDLLTTDGQSVIRTKAVRRIGLVKSGTQLQSLEVKLHPVRFSGTHR